MNSREPYIGGIPYFAEGGSPFLVVVQFEKRRRRWLIQPSNAGGVR